VFTIVLHSLATGDWNRARCIKHKQRVVAIVVLVWEIQYSTCTVDGEGLTYTIRHRFRDSDVSLRYSSLAS